MNVRARSTVDLGDLRIAGSLLLAAAAALPVLPGPDGVPCPLRSLTGIPCPLCGMTTSVTAAVHLDPLTALAANPAGWRPCSWPSPSCCSGAGGRCPIRSGRCRRGWR